MKLLTNSNNKKDFIGKRLECLCKNNQVNIATAFFTDSDFIEKIISQDCNVFLVVRLDQGTEPKALKKIINNDKVQIRYYTSKRFHPKLYIITNSTAIIGSSNLTRSGLGQNQELNVEVDFDTPIFDEINETFYEYWRYAEVLTKDALNKFEEIIDANRDKRIQIDKIVTRELGDVAPQNISILDKKFSKKDRYISAFRKKYQLYISAFNTLVNIYGDTTSERKWESIPIRIEIDRFLWWLRETQFKGDEYIGTPISTNEEIIQRINYLKSEYILTENEYLDTVKDNYKITITFFDSSSKIMSYTYDELFKGLLYVHAFHDRFRFYEGGLLRMKEMFLETNGIEKIKRTIDYIINGEEPYEYRIFKAIFHAEYKLKGFGESCVKELFGLVNNEDIPICNGRTLKSMEWLGFGKL